jgi:hypothetical protein
MCHLWHLSLFDAPSVYLLCNHTILILIYIEVCSVSLNVLYEGFICIKKKKKKKKKSLWDLLSLML